MIQSKKGVERNGFLSPPPTNPNNLGKKDVLPIYKIPSKILPNVLLYLNMTRLTMSPFNYYNTIIYVTEKSLYPSILP